MKSTYTFRMEDDMKFLNEQESEKLAHKMCEDYMTKCNCKDMNDAKLASQKLLAVANDLVETLHDGAVTIDLIN